MLAQEIVAGSDGHAHEPMFERRVAAEAREFLERLAPDFLNDVLDFIFAARVTTRGAENARRVFGHEWFEAGGVPLQHRGNQLRIGPFHRRGLWHPRQYFTTRLKERESLARTCQNGIVNCRFRRQSTRLPLIPGKKMPDLR